MDLKQNRQLDLKVLEERKAEIKILESRNIEIQIQFKQQQNHFQNLIEEQKRELNSEIRKLAEQLDIQRNQASIITVQFQAKSSELENILKEKESAIEGYKIEKESQAKETEDLKDELAGIKTKYSKLKQTHLNLNDKHRASLETLEKNKENFKELESINIDLQNQINSEQKNRKII